MMVFQGTPARLFYDFCLDDHVPSDHLLRSIDGHLDLDGLRQTLKPFYSQRDLHEDARDVARVHAATPEYVEACRRRKKVEMLFAHLKRIIRLTRLRLRGPNGAKDEFLLAATAQNLRRLARLRPINMLPEMLAT